MNNFAEEPHNPIITIEDPGKWVEMDKPELETMFAGLIDYVGDKEIDNIDWSRLSFGVYDEQYYRDKFGEGFDDSWYKLMAKATEHDNKVQDYRMPALAIEKKETTIKFD